MVEHFSLDVSRFALQVPAFGQRQSACVLASLAVFGAALGTGGCVGMREGGFDSPVPGARIEAIEATARHYRADRRIPDAATRQHLVECLHADDPLVRFMAIGTLIDITGETKGYRHDAPEAIRELAMPAWIAWANDPSVPVPTEPAP